MRGEVIDSNITPGSLITLNQRLRFTPQQVREADGFDLSKLQVPVWQVVNGKATPYGSVPSGSLATVIERYENNEVTKLEVLVNGTAYHCYGVHADVVTAQ